MTLFHGSNPLKTKSKIGTKKAKKNEPHSRSLTSDISHQPGPEKPIAVILGESPMVEVFAELCAAHGYRVAAALNNTPSGIKFSSPGIDMIREIPAQASVAIELTNLDLELKKKNLERLSGAGSPSMPILSSSITVTATEQSLWIERRHRLLGIAAFPTLLAKPLMEVAPTIFSPKETVEAAAYFFQTLGIGTEIVQDRIGMVIPRILCRLVNEALFAVMEDHAAPQDIDKAVQIGIGLPAGLIGWAERIGWSQICAVLDAIYNDTHEERYRAAPLLKHMALTGNWWNKQV